MEFLRKNIYRALAVCYRAAYLLHHKFCLVPDRQLPQKLGTTKLIVVGSYRTGGAGKTPLCLWLARELAKSGEAPRRISILCHSYAYDEIRMYREQLATGPSNLIEIAGTDNRHRTVLKLLLQDPPPDFIICDDGFEDSRLAGAVYIVLDDPNSTPRGIGDLWPAGPYRSLPKDHPLENALVLTPQDVSFSIESITNAVDTSISQSISEYRQLNVFCGIGAPERLVKDLQKAGIPIGQKTFLPDHSHNFARRLKQAIEQNPNDAFIITHKDACRLDPELRKDTRIYTVHQSVCIPIPILTKIRQFLRD